MSKTRFEWNDAKAIKNLRKHRISFDEAATVFDDPMLITFIDEEHSLDEECYITIGLSNLGRLLVVAHTERARIRIISARQATKKEAKFYAEAD
ncbi:MAG: BrnT family toxin [Anaerolineae bacterium]|nr:BrnT family toxin [Anaerolineae bacterium]